MSRAVRWLIPACDSNAVDALARALGVGRPAARVLCTRGLGDPAAAREFLHPSLANLHDPHCLLGMPAAVERLRRAIDRGEKVLIYGDYDVDGTTSVVILKKAIELAGGTADFHVPHRLKDGYGMRPEVVEAAAADGVRLIISVDTGIRAGEVVRRANELDIDVIITDHHLPEAELPPALAVLNPNRPGCPYPEKNLCGVGVAFKLVQGLLATLGWPAEKVQRITESFLKVVAIGTVADVVPLTGENRIIVKHGLSSLRSIRNPGLRALLDVAGFTGDSIPSATQVAFRIAPRMNAAGRMDTANTVIELLLTAEMERARELAQQLHDWNAERQQAEADVVQQIVEECAQTPVDDSRRTLVFCADGWHRGVLGIVASRLVERYHRPVFVLSRNPEDGQVQGSGRSISCFHLLAALESMPELFAKFGGHKHAAGVTLAWEQVDTFRERLNAYAMDRLSPADLVPEMEIDAVVNLPELTDEGVAQVLSLAPFGCGNPLPVFAAFGVEVAAPPVVWKEKHLRLQVRCNGQRLSLKAWNMATRAPELAPGVRLDIAFALEDDPYSAARGYTPWSAVLREFRHSDV